MSDGDKFLSKIITRRNSLTRLLNQTQTIKFLCLRQLCKCDARIFILCPGPHTSAISPAFGPLFTLSGHQEKMARGAVINGREKTIFLLCDFSIAKHRRHRDVIEIYFYWGDVSVHPFTSIQESFKIRTFLYTLLFHINKAKNSSNCNNYLMNNYKKLIVETQVVIQNTEYTMIVNTQYCL